MEIQKDKIRLNWKKDFFGNTTKIYHKNAEIGKLINDSWSDSAVAEFNDKKYRFKKKDIFSNTTLISDTYENKIVGKIIFDSWNTKANIQIIDNKYVWKSENFWKSKWNLSDENGIIIDFESKSSSGIINSTVQNNLLIITGLYITNYYLMILFFTIIILIPILMR